MKLMYCIGSMAARAGMENILFHKAKKLAVDYSYQIVIVTSDAGKGENCFPDIEGISYYDLNINYYKALNTNGIRKYTTLLRKNRKHKKRLQEAIESMKPDVIVSLGDLDEWILPEIHGTIPIVNECHFHYSYRVENYPGKVYQTIRLYFNRKTKAKYNKLIVLTKHDKEAWNLKNCDVITNFTLLKAEKIQNAYKNRKVIAAGRLTSQKGFDILLDIWKILKEKYENSKIWNLEIYGEGEDRDSLEQMIKENNLQEYVSLQGVSSNMLESYAKGSIFALSSRYEGFPLVLIEAMSCGLVPVAFDCKQGPNEIMISGTGYLIPQYDKELYAEKLYYLMTNEDVRMRMSEKCRIRANEYDENKIIREWAELFEKLTV